VATVELVDIRKEYQGVQAVKDLTLRVEQGEFFSLLGPSGCGKSTTLRMVAGFVPPTSGRILIGNQDVTSLPPEKREVGIVFQNYAIFPHMNVYDNIAYGLKLRKVSKSEIQRKVEEALATVGLSGYGHRRQRELSGGQQQRVALARVLVCEPRILLLDEPLSALDKKLREEMKFWIKGLQQSLGITTIYVTHDQGEALTMSDRIAVMNQGIVEQLGTPREVYERPASRFVTDFIGESNILEGEVASSSAGVVEILFGGQRIRAPRTFDVSPGAKVSVVVRPEHIKPHPAPNSGDYNVIHGTLTAEAYQGAIIRYEIAAANQRLVAEVQNTAGGPAVTAGSELAFGWPVDATTVLQD
jgi:putative spermidine/putrescine transport system ATP-binding protein